MICCHCETSRRALVHVRRPHVERHDGNLEAKAGKQEHQPEHDPDAAGGYGRRDPGKADGSGKAIDQRGAVQQHARRQRAEDEIFQAGLGRFGVVAVAGGDHVECKAHQLEPEIEHDQVAGRDQHHHAEGREQHQDRIFEDPPRRIGQELGRQDQRRGRADQRENLQEAGKIVDDEAAAESHELSSRQQQFQSAGQNQKTHRKRGDGAGHPLSAIGTDHQQHHGADGEHQLRQHRL
jgi:hypothetical protein